MITDQQVLLMRQKQKEGKTQLGAAAMAGMSERSARKWQAGPLPSERPQERHWRTRTDPFDGIWAEEIEPLLEGEAAGRLKATTIIEWLEERHPGRFSASQLRTLQRRLHEWRTLHGPEREVYFPQEHPPGREAQIDFTHCNGLRVAIGGRPHRHLLFQFVLSHSGWRYAEVVSGETFMALRQGLQAALRALGGAPQVIHSDNSSALTHELRRSRGRALNNAYAELLEHYGLESMRSNPGASNENGVVEQAHYRLKDALDQALMLRGSRDFDSKEEYACFVRMVVERRNRLVAGKLEVERLHLQPLPPVPVPEYVNYRARVRKWSTIQAAGRTYTVPSRLIGEEVQVRLYADSVEVLYRGNLMERMERVRGEREARVDYRHVIDSLVRKPGAFARYRFREHLFPTMTFRLAYDALKGWRVSGLTWNTCASSTSRRSPWSPRCRPPSPSCWRPESHSTMARSRRWPVRLRRWRRCSRCPGNRTSRSTTACWRGWPDGRRQRHAEPDRRAVPSVPVAHYRCRVGVPFHRSGARRRAVHLPGGVGAGSRGPSAAAHRPAAQGVQAARRQDLGDVRARACVLQLASATG